jgi:hypothetical protein
MHGKGSFLNFQVPGTRTESDMIPKCSMVLAYLPTFTLKITQFCRFLYTSTMEHMGLVRWNNPTISPWKIRPYEIPTLDRQVSTIWEWYRPPGLVNIHSSLLKMAQSKQWIYPARKWWIFPVRLCKRVPEATMIHRLIIYIIFDIVLMWNDAFVVTADFAPPLPLCDNFHPGAKIDPDRNGSGETMWVSMEIYSYSG